MIKTRVWLKELRMKQNKTQDAIANEAKISRQYYSFIESGKRQPKPQNAKAIASALDFDWTRFYDESEPTERGA